ncbi:MAG: purine-nucleoside phosphorylase [Kiritimatiellales bacterium]
MGLMLSPKLFSIKPMQAINQITMDEAVSALKSLCPQAKPRIGIILGSGWGGAIEGFSVRATVPYEKIPNLGKTGAPGHAGQLISAELNGIEVFIFQGRRHLYEGEGWMPVVLPVWILKQFGAQAVLLTNASGGIREDLRPGMLMALEDHINMLGGSPLTGPHNSAFGDRFPDQSEVYDSGLREVLIEGGADVSGVYLATGGPSFETPAEVRAFRAMGADAVGMSTVPEAIFANALGLRIAGLSCICNWASGLGDEKLSGEDVIRTADEAMPRMRSAIEYFVKEVS